MDEKELIERTRDVIRSFGFRSAVQLAVDLACLRVESEAIFSIFEQIPCEDIFVVEYANKETADYRRKDLYYYQPK